MYSVIGIRRLLAAYAVLAFILSCAIVMLERVSLASATAGGSVTLIGFLLGSASKGLSGAGLLVWVLGETSLFSFVCRCPGIRRFIPDLDGEWVGTLESNWPQVSSRLSPDQVGQVAHSDTVTAPTEVSVRFQVRLFSVTMNLDTDTWYSDSETLLVGVERRPGSDMVEVRYIYRNRTRRPLPTDSGSHLGAAILDLERRDGEPVLSGQYWTNRNWHMGLNTAGILTLRRAARPDLGALS